MTSPLLPYQSPFPHLSPPLAFPLPFVLPSLPLPAPPNDRYPGISGAARVDEPGSPRCPSLPATLDKESIYTDIARWKERERQRKRQREKHRETIDREIDRHRERGYIDYLDTVI